MRVVTVALSLALTLVAAPVAGEYAALPDTAAPAPPLVVDWSAHLPWRPLFSWRSVESAAPVLRDGSVFVATARGRAVFRLDGVTGETRWSRSVPGQVEATIALDKERVYVGDSKGWLHGLDLKDGRVVWKENLGGVVLGSLLQADGTVYAITSDNRLHARNAGTGEERWTYRHDSPSGITVYGTSSPVAAGGRILAGFSDGTLVAIRRADGGSAWSKKLVEKGRFRDIDSTPAVDGERIYVSSFAGKIHCLNLADGQEVWAAEPGGSTGIVLSGDRLFYGTDAGEVVAREAADGRLVWQHKLKKGLPSTPLVTDEVVWVGSSSAAFFALDAEKGGRRWKFDPLLRLSGFNAPAILGDGRILVLSNSGTLYSLKPESTESWKFDSAWEKKRQEEDK